MGSVELCGILRASRDTAAAAACSMAMDTTTVQSMRTGPDLGEIGPLHHRGFLAGTVPADLFVLPNSSSFWSHFCAADYKTTNFFFLKHFAVVLNYLPNERILRGEATGTGFVLFTALEASS